MLHIKVPEPVQRAGVRVLLLYRKLRYGYSFRRIKLTQGQYAIVDAEVYEELNKYQWYAHKNKNTYYAYRAARADEKRTSKLVKMHEEVMKLQGNFINPNIEILNPKQIQKMKINSKYETRNPKLDKPYLYDVSDGNGRVIIDHINGDGRDNRAANLRFANYSQNSQNRRKIRRRCASQYKGVQLNKKTNRWRAQICFGGMKKHLGYYNGEAEAARAYDAAAIKYHGRFARLNFERRGAGQTESEG